MDALMWSMRMSLAVDESKGVHTYRVTTLPNEMQRAGHNSTGYHESVWMLFRYKCSLFCSPGVALTYETKGIPPLAWRAVAEGFNLFFEAWVCRFAQRCVVHQPGLRHLVLCRYCPVLCAMYGQPVRQAAL